MVPVLLGAILALPAVPTLAAYAVLPAETFVEGPTSGQYLTRTNGIAPPFVLQQPVQGISSVIPGPAGRLIVLTDNGFGTQANSADSMLAFHVLAPAFRNARGGSGTVKVERTFFLRDSAHWIPWPIVAELETYPKSPFPVDEEVQTDRWLTGADFDPESFRQTRDGNLWFGDEFGPFLLNTDHAGRLLRAPIPVPGVTAPENPKAGPANLASSRGIEGMAMVDDGWTLLCLLEGAVAEESDRRRLKVLEFDARRPAWTGRAWTYTLDDPSHSVGEMTWLDRRRVLVIERDGRQGDDAAFKRVFLVDLERPDSKTLVVDLLKIDDPDDLDLDGRRTYRMPFTTIESLAILDETTLLVANDNNFPFGSGRRADHPEATEFVKIRLPRPLG